MGNGRGRIGALAQAALLAAFLAAGCRGDGAEEPPETLPEERPESHRRMVAELARIAEQSERDNPYFGLEPLPAYEAQLQALPAGASPERWRVLRELSEQALRLGRLEEAVAYLEEAHAMAPSLPGMPAQAAARGQLMLALAYLRQGEVFNCARNYNAESCILPIRGGGVHKEQGPSLQAIDELEQLLSRVPAASSEALTARWLLNLAHMTVGSYPDGVPAGYRIDPAVFQGPEMPVFRNVGLDQGLFGMDHAGGIVADDFDGDGDIDLLFSTSAPDGPLKFYVNRLVPEGSWGFDERSEEAGLEGLFGGLNMVQADFDNDGDQDVFIPRGAWWRQLGRHPNSLLRNDGPNPGADRPVSRFTDVTFEAGLGKVHYPTQAAGWADYDLDGDLDLFVGNEHGELSAPSQLFRNNGDGTFVDVAGAAGVDNLRFAKAVSWGDYDGDRYPDLFISNMSQGSAERGTNRLYRNNGDGTFTDVAPKLGLTEPVASFPAWFWDYDNDGHLDLYVSSYGGLGVPPQVAVVAAAYLGWGHPGEKARLYRGDGRGGFTDVAAEAGLQRAALPMGGNFGDIDQDGLLDVYLGTGYPLYEGLMPNVMYLNRGGRFEDVTFSAGFGHLQKGHGIAFADVSGDGYPEVIAQMGGMYRGDAFANALFENPGFSGQSVVFELRGNRSNRAGVGARLTVEILAGGSRRQVHREVGSGGSFGANPLQRYRVGLGKVDALERVEVYWPATDRRMVFAGLDESGVHPLGEGQERFTVDERERVLEAWGPAGTFRYLAQP